ncbi:hypothetical protein [Bacillus mycoides]|uniref:hypothetical protein n=1 Tax=Bacillus mycoides TaxID=1405 RepID=UPI00027C1790|nr:hypothetical protein [Bacillus mycoides]EJV59329.1 hypothetical protein IEU_05594 [Bacillus mycoides]
MTVLDDYLKNHLPSKEAAKVHIHLVIKNYSQLGEYKFYKQLDITARGLYVAGFSPEMSIQIVSECLDENNYEKRFWYNDRDETEIVKPKGE